MARSSPSVSSPSLSPLLRRWMEKVIYKILISEHFVSGMWMTASVLARRRRKKSSKVRQTFPFSPSSSSNLLKWAPNSRLQGSRSAAIFSNKIKWLLKFFNATLEDILAKQKRWWCLFVSWANWISSLLLFFSLLRSLRRRWQIRERTKS